MTTLLWIHELVKQAGETARGQGFWSDADTFGDVTKSWTTEKGKPEGVPSELADIVIRVGDMCARYKIDLAYEIERKLKYNQTRPMLHGGRVLHTPNEATS